MNSIKNNVRLVGNLGQDPEVKDLEGKRKLVKFSMATNENYKNEKGEKVTETQWHNVVVWGKLAEVAGKFLKKGREVIVDGKLNSRSYTDKAGAKKYVTEVVALDILFLGDPKAGASK